MSDETEVDAQIAALPPEKKSLFDSLYSAYHQALAPIAYPVQQAAEKVVRPVLQATGDTVADLNQPVLDQLPAGAEYAVRKAGEGLFGSFGKPSTVARGLQGQQDFASASQTLLSVGDEAQPARRPEEVDPATALRVGQTAARAAGQLPLVLIPGPGEGAIAQGLWGGFVQGVATPGADVVDSTTIGGALGAAGKVASKVLGKLGSKAATVAKPARAAASVIEGEFRVIPNRPEVTPLAVVPGEHVDEFVNKLVSAEPKLLPAGEPLPEALPPGPPRKPYTSPAVRTREALSFDPESFKEDIRTGLSLARDVRTEDALEGVAVNGGPVQNAVTAPSVWNSIMAQIDHHPQQASIALDEMIQAGEIDPNNRVDRIDSFPMFNALADGRLHPAPRHSYVNELGVIRAGESGTKVYDIEAFQDPKRPATTTPPVRTNLLGSKRQMVGGPQGYGDTRITPSRADLTVIDPAKADAPYAKEAPVAPAAPVVTGENTDIASKYALYPEGLQYEPRPAPQAKPQPSRLVSLSPEGRIILTEATLVPDTPALTVGTNGARPANVGTNHRLGSGIAKTNQTQWDITEMSNHDILKLTRGKGFVASDEMRTHPRWNLDLEAASRGIKMETEEQLRARAAAAGTVHPPSIDPWDVTTWPEKLRRAQAQLGPMPDDLVENGIVVVSGQGDALELQHINSPTFQRASLLARGLVRVQTPDGPKYGFLSIGGSARVIHPPSPDENLPNALAETLDGTKYSWRAVTSRDDLDDILIERAALRRAAKNAAQTAQLTAGLPPNPPAPPPPGQPPLPPGASTGGNGQPPSLPPGTPPSMGGPTPPGTPPSPDPAQAVSNQFQALWNSGMKKLGLTHTTLSSPDLAKVAAIRQLRASATATRTIENDYFKAIFRTFAEDMPKSQLKEFEADLNRWADSADNAATAKAMEAKYAAVSKFNAQTAAEMRIAIDVRTEHLRGLDMLPSMAGDELASMAASTDPKVRAELDEYFATYFNTGYLRFALKPRVWADAVRKGALSKEHIELAKDVISNWVTERNPTYTPKEVAAETDWVFEDLIGANDGLAIKDVARTGRADGYWVQALRARNDLPEPIARAMGRIDNGMVRLARTLARQEQAIAVGETMKMVTETPGMWFPPSTPVEQLPPTPLGRNWTKLPDSVKFGMARGGWVHPDMKDALESLPNDIAFSQSTMASALHVAQGAIRVVKLGQTALNPGSYMTQVLGNVSGIAISGMNMSDVPKMMVQAHADGAAFLKEFATAGTSGSSPAAYRFYRARQLSVQEGSFGKSELGDVHNYVERELMRQYRSRTGNILADLHTVWNKVNLPRHLYQMPDEYSKYSAWLGLMKKAGVDLNAPRANAITDPEHAIWWLGPGKNPGAGGDLLRAIEDEAAIRVRKSFPYLNATGKVAGIVQQGGGLVTAPYGSVKWEMIRTWGHIPERLATEPGYKFHMTKVVAATSAMMGAAWAIHKFTGPSGRACDEAWEKEPPGTKALYPAAVCMPIWDAKHRPQFIDLSKLVEPLQYLQGDPSINPAIRVAFNLAYGNTLQGSVAEATWAPWLSGALKSVGLGGLYPNYQKTPNPHLGAWDFALDASKQVAKTVLPVTGKIDTALNQNVATQKPFDARMRPGYTTGQSVANAFIPVIPGPNVTGGKQTDHAAEALRLQNRQLVKDIKSPKYREQMPQIQKERQQLNAKQQEHDQRLKQIKLGGKK